ncbi:MAG: DNA polymerase Y family protein [Bifidobacteriaceae bacterium]|jgi:protein ImuB|nr:DNA polymerase Y family protein [Bifidobacteriaceae bacterium]
MNGPADRAVDRPARRLAVVWVPDWPVVAAIRAGLAALETPVMVVDTRRVKALSAAARRQGVRLGMKRRSAGELCPQGVMVPADPARDSREFDQVASLVHGLVPGVELLRPGLLLCPAVGASRYHGGDHQLAEHLLEQVTANTGTEAWAGVADGVLAAILAARESRVVPPGGSPDFLAPRPLRDLGLALRGTAHGEDLDVLMDLLYRLGIRTLGDLAGLPGHHVTERFGRVGVWAQRLAQAKDAVTAPAHRLNQEFSAASEADEPITQVDQAAFAARALAADLHARLAAHGYGYDRLKVSATTEAGEQLERTWRLEGVDAAGVVDRVRWQLEGWLTGRSGLLPSGGLTRLELTAEEVHPAGQGTVRLWGGEGHAQARAVRGAERLHTLLGGQGVYQPVLQGGRDPRGRVRLVQWGDDPAPLRPLDRPWPGTLPDPAPAVVPAVPVPVAVSDAAGQPVRVSAALELSGKPAWVGQAAVQGWAGPWPVVEQWWNPRLQRRVYLQVQVVGEVPDCPAQAQASPPAQVQLQASTPAGPPVQDRSRMAVPAPAAQIPAAPGRHPGLGHLSPGQLGGTHQLLLACEAGEWRLEGVYE